jgi:hypothetical protein
VVAAERVDRRRLISACRVRFRLPSFSASDSYRTHIIYLAGCVGVTDPTSNGRTGVLGHRVRSAIFAG